MYGVKLIQYEGMGEMNMWVGPLAHGKSFLEDGRAGFESWEEAHRLANMYFVKNPKGTYIVEEFSEKEAVPRWERL